MFFNLFLLKYLMKLSNYCCVLVYILQTLALLMARNFRHNHMIQVWILMMIGACQMRRIIRRSVQRDMFLLVRQYRLFLGMVDLILDIGQSCQPVLMSIPTFWSPIRMLVWNSEGVPKSSSQMMNLRMIEVILLFYLNLF